MAPPPPRYRAAMERRGKQAKASRARVAARGRAAKAHARVAQQRAQGRPTQRAFRARSHLQHAEATGGGDESDSGDSHILDPPGDGGSEAEHPASDDDMAGGVPAILGQPGGLFALLPGDRVRAGCRSSACTRDSRAGRGG